MSRAAKHLLGLALGASLMGGCASVSETLSGPQLTPISNPATVAGARRVSMPLPAPYAEAAGANSLWRTGARSFFNDQRADEIGDLLTVNIEIADSAQVNNTTQRSRTSTTEAGVQALLGFEANIVKALPGSPSLDPAIGFDSSSASNGSGTVNRAETVSLTVAAVITDRLPNGNLVIGGSQEVRINNELRELLVSGVIRPEDIAADNTIEHTKIAEARISYGGRGDLSQVQRDRYGKLLYDQVAPF
ncbi:MAG: flagellar basal body L-ring protein FlgH [Alphaproteobacteria bacterium]|nr:flagellar basal body L-ring protein FlgH [Alphaproteobacteria bacterium]